MPPATHADMSYCLRSALRRLAIAMSFPLSALIVACGETTPASQDAVVIRDSAGVSMVTSYRAQWAEDAGWQIDASPRTTLGGAESDTNQHWRFVEDAALLSDGRVVVAVQGELRWFNADGTHIQTGGAGDGPGEFRYVKRMYVLAGDSVRVHDSRGSKYAVFAPDGAFAYEVRTDLQKLNALGRWIECGTAILADGSRLLCQSDPSIPETATNRPTQRLSSGRTSPGPGLWRSLHRVWLITPSLDRAYPLGIGAGIEQFGVSEGGGFVSHPFYSRSITAAGGDPMRIATVLNPDYRIELWTPDGRLERVVMRADARRAPTAAELVDVPDALRARVRASDSAAVERIIAEVPTPDSLPAMRHLILTARGELVVMREGVLPSHTQSLYDVLDPTGVWLGTVQMDNRAFISSVQDSTMLVRRINEDGGQLIEVYGYRR